MLNLQEKDLVGGGTQRSVYLHPLDRTKLVKVLKPDADAPVENTFGKITEWLIPSIRIRQIRKEYEEYLRIMLAHRNAHLHLKITHMFGFVATNKGLGCLTERVMGADGSIGETLTQKISQKRLMQTDVDLLNDTISWMYKHHIRASDMNANNFVFGCRDNGTGCGPLECVLVDGFGDIHAIPVRTMARWMNRLGLDDSCRRLARRNSGLIWNGKARKFSML